MSIKKYKYIKKNSFDIKKAHTKEKDIFISREQAVKEFVANLKEINVLQQKLYAERKEGVIFVFQAMDAAGKDGCIRTVFSTLTPHGVKEFCFKKPSDEENSHDYLWRFWSALPARGHISIFNRSYYEDVLIGKVHKLYENQIVPDRMKNVDVIEKRYKEINDFEKYLYNNATRVVKIFLNVSKDEQAKRFISRINTPCKNWKVSEGDIKEREYWDDYQEAFEAMINNTSSKNSPWYVVPADRKWYARLVVSRIVLETLREINPQFPIVDENEMNKMQTYKEQLIATMTKKEKSKNVVKDTNIKEQSANDETNALQTDTSPENVFFNASNIMTESYISEEQKKTEEKEKKNNMEVNDERFIK
jgi:PPK2 family polyphosphate:nucleotide phosphotransferase